VAHRGHAPPPVLASTTQRHQVLEEEKSERKRERRGKRIGKMRGRERRWRGERCIERMRGVHGK